MYSKDFDFFVKEQIATGQSRNSQGVETVFFSRLDGTRFKKIVSPDPLTDERVTEICKEIHLTVSLTNEYLIKYNLHKDRSPVIDGFKTEALRDEAIKSKEKEGYSPVKIENSDKSINYHLGIRQ